MPEHTPNPPAAVPQQATRATAPAAARSADTRLPTRPGPAAPIARSDLPRFGNYQALEQIGTGATAVVYRAQHQDTGKIVAVKVISFDSQSAKMNRRLKKLFATEAATATRVRHPNIVEIHEAVFEDTRAYIVMEYIEGRPLRDFCWFDSLLPPHQVVDIMFKCAMALDYAARRGVIHRDIKPDNIVLTADGDVKIMDFGLALNLKKDSSDSTFVMGVGSPAYMSPEQIKDYPLNGQTDLYSLGTVMYEMLTGRLAFRAQNRAALMYKIVNMDADPVSALNPAVPPEFDPIVRKALEKDLYSRYKRGVELAQDLSGAKFQILDDADSTRLQKRFAALRTCKAFIEFGNDEIWEVLRISYWRIYNAGRQFVTEGRPGCNFGVILEGEVEVSLKGKQLAVLGPGELVGELAYLLPAKPERTTSMMALTDVVFLEVSGPAFELSTEECRQHFRDLVARTMIDRITAQNERLIASAPEARRPTSRGDFGLELMPKNEDDETTSSIFVATDGGVRTDADPWHQNRS